MKQALLKLVMSYLTDVSNNTYSNEDLEYMANKFVEDYNRIELAIQDFE